MVDRMRCRRLVWVVPIAGAALLIGLEVRRAAKADVPRCGGAGCPNCPVNSKFFGYYPTMWRRWPGTEPVPQPTNAPATGGAEVPIVEPPPAMDETENKAKSPPPETPTGPGGSSTEPGPDPNAKRPMAPAGNGAGSNRLELPSPDAGEPGPLPAPSQINRLHPAWGNELAPAMSESLGPVLSIPSSSSPTWPPPNFLRSEEIRAGFQSEERAAHAESTSASRPGLESQNLTVVGDASLVIRTPAARATLTEKPTNQTPAHADTAECDAGSLNWVDKSQRPQDKTQTPAASAEPIAGPCAGSVTDSGGRDSPRDFTHEAAAPINGDGRTPSVAARIPFVPSNSLHDPLAPIEPKSLTGAKEPVGRTPTDAPSNQLVPSNRVSDVPHAPRLTPV